MKIAVVTGSSRGIGFAMTQRLLSNGYEVYGLARTHPEILTAQANYREIAVDLSQIESVTKTGQYLKKTLLTLDVFIACAGVGQFHELEQFSDQSLLDVLNVNLNSPILLSKYCLPLIKKQSGKMIFIGSEADHHAHKKGSIYCASKFGLRGFVKSLRLECLSRAVAVTLISPGLVDSSFYAQLDFEPGEAIENKVQVEQIVEAMSMVLSTDHNACVEELHIAPMKHVVKKKKGKAC